MLKSFHGIKTGYRLNILERSWLLLTKTYDVFCRSNVPRNAAAMTYYMMLSLAPMLMIAIAVASLFFCTEQVNQEIVTSVSEYANPEIAHTIGELLANTTSTTSCIVASGISLAILLFAASGVFGQLFDTFNDIWDVPYHVRRSVRFNLRRQLVGMAMVISVGALLVGSLGLGTALSYLNRWLEGNFPGLSSYLLLADQGLSFLLIPFVLSLMFWYFPMHKMEWSDVWPAAGLTAGLLVISRSLIDLYLRLSTANEVYGAAGSLVVLLVWVYLTGIVLFIGASFSCAWTRLFGSLSDFENPRSIDSDGVIGNDEPFVASIDYDADPYQAESADAYDIDWGNSYLSEFPAAKFSGVFKSSRDPLLQPELVVRRRNSA